MNLKVLIGATANMLSTAAILGCSWRGIDTPMKMVVATLEEKGYTIINH